MRVVYRMRGLMGDATEDIIETLDSGSSESVDEEQLYHMADTMSQCGGLEAALTRCACVCACVCMCVQGSGSGSHKVCVHACVCACMLILLYGTVHRKLYDNYVCRLTLSPICLGLSVNIFG